MDKETEELLNYQVSDDSSSENNFLYENDEFSQHEEMATKSQQHSLSNLDPEKHFSSATKKVSKNENSVIDSNQETSVKTKSLFFQKNLFKQIN